MNRIFHTRSSGLRALIVIVFSMVLFACAKPQQGPSLPEVSLGVVPFTQPRGPIDMLAGYAPEDAPEVPGIILPQLDDTLHDVLRKETKRTFAPLEAYVRCRNAKAPGQGAAKVAALHHWTAVGMCMKVDFLLVPQILAFQDREGGEAGITRPASVTMDIFLVDVKNNMLTSRSHFDETQVALTDNLLTTGKFFSRGGKWITGVQLAREGMQKAVKDLGL